jgi:hypothetical protein
MSLTKDHGDIVFQCDGKGCRETLETSTSNFDSARNVLTRNKWRPKKDPATDVWLHFCTDCQKGPLL